MNRKDFLNSLNPRRIKYTSKPLDPSKLRSNLERLIALGLASFTIVGFSGCAHSNNNKEFMPTTSQSISVDPYKYLNNPDAILEDFKTRYIEEYNKVNGTEHTAGNIELHHSWQPYLYITSDGQLVTHGSHPTETEKVLRQHGDFKRSGGDFSVFQIICSDSGIPLETCCSSGKTVLSGNVSKETLLENLNCGAGNRITELGKLADLASIVADATAVYQDPKPYIEKYVAAIKEIDAKNIDDTTR